MSKLEAMGNVTVNRITPVKRQGSHQVWLIKLSMVVGFLLVCFLLVYPASVSAAGVEVGTIVFYAGPDVPTGWLAADGSAVSRSQYPELFAKIGTLYGVGDGSTTFNLPNVKGRFLVGADADFAYFEGPGYEMELAESGGEYAHRLSIDEMPSHDHYIGDTYWPEAGGLYAAQRQSGTYHVMGNSTSSTGGNYYHQNTPPYLATNPLIAALPNVQAPTDYITYDQGQQIIALLQSIDTKLNVYSSTFTATLTSGDIVTTQRSYTYGEQSISGQLFFSNVTSVLGVIIFSILLLRIKK